MEYELVPNFYTYHIKDEYFDKMGNDKGLMNNKENGGFRPNYYAIKDKNSSILWMIPLSTKISKYEEIRDKKIAKKGKCLTIVISKYGGKKSAFLLQNMFPILPKYIDHVHTKNGSPLLIHKGIKKEIEDNFKEIMRQWKFGVKLLFTKIDIMYQMQLQEYEEDTIKQDKLINI